MRLVNTNLNIKHEGAEHQNWNCGKVPCSQVNTEFEIFVNYYYNNVEINSHTIFSWVFSDAEYHWTHEFQQKFYKLSNCLVFHIK